MECVQGVLKSSFRPDMAVKNTHQQVFLDDLWAFNGGQSGGSADDFFVDDLLDFSKEDGFVEEPKIEEEIKDEKSSKIENEKNNAGNFRVSVPDSEPLCVPVDELADLEWLSNFVDDDSGYSLTCPVGKLPEKFSGKKCSAPEIPAPEKPSLATPVQTKARTKRARTGARVWSLGSRSSTDCSTSSSSSSTCTSKDWLIYDCTQTAESFSGKPPVKKQKNRRPATDTGGGGGARRCNHCGVQKTPQWRAGPLGAKTLCNACGVRFKSGRLLPEYRPACSPTFSSEVHSNNHRKVLEMRRKKEIYSGLERL